MRVRSGTKRALARESARALLAVSLVATLTTFGLVLSQDPARAAVSSAIDLVSRQGGTEFENPAFADAISADGRFVAFATSEDIAAGDSNDLIDVYVKDLETGQISWISAFEQSDSVGENAASFAPAISADGRVIAFETDYPYRAADAGDPLAFGDRGIWYVDRGPADATGGFPEVFCDPIAPVPPCMPDPDPTTPGPIENASVSTTWGPLVDYTPGDPALDISTAEFIASDACDDDCFIYRPSRPSISADGTQIVFEVRDEGNNDLHFVAIRDLDRNRDGVIAPGDADKATLMLGASGGDYDFGQNVSVGFVGAYLTHPEISADGMHVVFSDHVSVDTALAVVYDRTLSGAGALDQPGNRRFSVVTTDDLTVLGGDRTTEFTQSLTPAINADGTVVAYAFRYRIDAIESPVGLPYNALNIVVVDRDATGGPVGARVISGTGSPEFRDYTGGFFPPDSAYPVLSDDGRMVAFLSEARHFTSVGVVGTSGCPAIGDIDAGPSGASARQPRAAAPAAAPAAPQGATGEPCHVYAVDLAHERDFGFAPVLVDQDGPPPPTPGPSTTAPATGGPGDDLAQPPDMNGSGRLVSFSSRATNLVEEFPADDEDDVFILEWTPLVFPVTPQLAFPATPVGATSNGSIPIVFDTNDFGPWEVEDIQIFGPHEQDFEVDFSDCSGEVFHAPVQIFDPETDSYVTITDNCSVTVRFSPTAIGTREADVFVRQRSVFAVSPAHAEVTGTASLPEARGQTERVSERIPEGENPAQLFGQSSNPALSANGRFVAFELDQDLDPRDANGAVDIYVRDLLTGDLDVVSLRDQAEVIPAALIENPPGPYDYDPGSYDPAVSADGRYVVYESRDPKTSESPDFGGFSDFEAPDIFLVDRGAPDANGAFTGEATVILVSAFGDSSAEADHHNPTISGDGTQVAWECRSMPFEGSVPCLVEDGEINDFRGTVFVRDFDTDGDGIPGPQVGPPRSVRPPSPFEAVPLPDDWSNTSDPNGPDYRPSWPETDDAYEPALSADGSHLAFVAITDTSFEAATSEAAAAGPKGGFGGDRPVVWVVDRDLDGDGRRDEPSDRGFRIATTTEFSLAGVDGNAVFPLQHPLSETYSGSPAISGDGMTVAYEFTVLENDLEVGLPQDLLQIVVSDRAQPNGAFTTSEIVSIAGPVEDIGFFEEADDCPSQFEELDFPTFIGNCINIGDNHSFDPAISDDGRYVTFSTLAGNLHVDDATEQQFGYGCDGPLRGQNPPPSDTPLCDVLVVDRIAPGNAGAPQLVNVPDRTIVGTDGEINPDAPEFPTGDSSQPDISADGRVVVYASDADNLLGYEPCPGGAPPSLGICPDEVDGNFAYDVFLREWEPETEANRPQLTFPLTAVGATTAPQAVELSTLMFGPDPVLQVAIVGGNAGDFVLSATQNCLPVLSEEPAAEVRPVPEYGIVHIDDESRCIPNVAFRPTAAGPRSSTLVVRLGGAPRSLFEPQVITIPLSGTGRQGPPDPNQPDPGTPVFSVSAPSLDFGEEIVGVTSPQQTLTVTNTGSAPFRISSVVVQTAQANPDTAGDYQIVSTDCANRILQPGESCQVTLTFKPKAPGERPAILRFDDDAPGNPHLVQLTGRAPEPTINVNPTVTASGRIVFLTGANWEPGTQITVVTVDQRQPAVQFPEVRTVIVNGEGGFTDQLLIFPRSAVGPRLVIAQGPTPEMTARAGLLVSLPTVNGPDFVHRS